MRAMKMRSRRGLTLVEMLFVSAILVFTILALLLVFITSLRHIAIANEISIAADDLKDILEKIRSIGFSQITTTYPDGGSVVPEDIGGFVLPEEVLVVTYPGGAGNNPLRIDVTVSWRSVTGSAASKTFRTIRTKML